MRCLPSRFLFPACLSGVEGLIENGEVLRLSNEVVQPFYREKAQQAQEWLREVFDDSLPCRVHRSEGALFLWLWFEDLPITSRELYERLKACDVLVVPGNHFFCGLNDEDWPRRNGCLRVSFTMSEEVVRGSFAVIADAVKKA